HILLAIERRLALCQFRSQRVLFELLFSQPLRFLPGFFRDRVDLARLFLENAYILLQTLVSMLELFGPNTQFSFPFFHYSSVSIKSNDIGLVLGLQLLDALLIRC